MKHMCIICFDDINTDKIFICLNCKERCCVKCIKNENYYKPECSNCFTGYQEKQIKNNFTHNDIKSIYLPYYTSKQIQTNTNTQEKIQKYLKKQKNKDLLRFGFQILADGDQQQQRVFCYIKKCSQTNCKGYVNINYVCEICDGEFCKTCEELILKKKTDTNPDVSVNQSVYSHTCKEETLTYLNLMKNSETHKKCPYCFVYIEKSFGCNDMKCTYCGASFNWRTLEIEKKIQNNAHYNNIINKEDNLGYKEYIGSTPKHNKPEFLRLTQNNVLPEIKTFFNSCLSIINSLHAKIDNKEIEYYISKNTKDKNINRKTLSLYNYYKKKEYNNNIINYLMNETSQNLENLTQLQEYLEYLNNETITPNNIMYTIKNNSIIKYNLKTNKTIFYNNKNPETQKDLNQNQHGITLLDSEQNTHAENVIKKLKCKKCLDVSYAGSGKTYISLYAAKKLNVKKLLILCPKLMTDKWENIINTYNNYNKFEYKIISTSKLSSYYTVNDNNIFTVSTNNNGRLSIVFSKEFCDYFDENTMFIIDEIHILRNYSAKGTKIIIAMSELASRNNSYILGLSATPIETQKQIHVLTKKFAMHDYLKIIKNSDESIYKPHEYQIMLFTILIHQYTQQEFIEKLKKHMCYYSRYLLDDLNKILILLKKKNLIDNDEIFNYLQIKFQSKLKKPIFDLLVDDGYSLTDTIKILYYSTNPTFTTTLGLMVIKLITYNISDDYKTILNKKSHNKHCYLTTFCLSEEEEKRIELAFSDIDVKTNKKIETIHLITKGLIQTETVYLNTIRNLVEHIMNNFPKFKIVIALNFNVSITDMSDGYKKQQQTHLVINGKQPNNNKSINLFQKDDNTHRLLIVNPACLNTGVDLDDKTGNHPRFIIFSPDFKSINMYQFLARFKRKDSMSEPFIQIINNHQNIISNLYNKVTINKHLNLDMTYINQFPKWKETNNYTELNNILSLY